VKKWTLRADGIKVPKVEGVQASQATGGSEMNRIVVGVDIAKRVFQLHWVEPATGEIVALQLKRERFLEHFAHRSKCLIGMEACGGSQHWARSLQKLGHEVKLLSARMVKPFVGGNKNDAADARGIWTAVQQPGIKAVAVKSEEQQAVLALHRMREQLVKFRTAQINGLRGLLTEYGEVMPQGRAGIKRDIAGALGRLSDRLPGMVIETLREQYARLGELDEQISQIERRLGQWQRRDSATKRIAAIPGVGLLSATAAVATMGDAKAFKSGREFAAWLGLVPRQSGTGGRVRLLGISKRGDKYLRTLLIHGARAVLTHGKSPPEWLNELLKRRPKNVAVVAMANKMARTIWALLAHERAYQSGYVSRPA
jgi:transposase